MRRDDAIRVAHMIEAIRDCSGLVSGRERSDVDSDLMLQLALARIVEIFGEAASRVSPEARAKAPSLPWAAIVAMRNRLAHAYFDIDRDILWTTATEEFPALLAPLQTLARAKGS